MKRVATVGAKFCKSHKFVSSPTSSFSSLSDLAEHHGIIENNEGVVIPSSNESSGLSPRKLRHAATCDDLSNVFENLSLEDEATTSSSIDLYNDETISNSSLLSTTTTTTTLSNTSNNNNCTIDSKEAAELEEESSIASAPIPVTVTRVSKKTRVQKKKVTKSVIPPQSDENKGKKTIVLDLDETLIKSFYQEPEVFDFAIDIEFPHMGSLIQQHVYIKKRPGLEDFLQTLVEKFELIIFTAALPVYADAILKHIDPSAKLFSHVLYRHHCNGSGMFPGKDLRILGRNLDHTLLVDDGVMNFLQPKNGLLIKSFKGEESDRMLTDVIAPFLLQLDDPDRTVYEIIDKYRKFIAVTTSFDLADTIERSHYSYYLNISSTSKTLYSVSY